MDDGLETLTRDMAVFLAQVPKGTKERAAFQQFLAGRPEKTVYEAWIEGTRQLFRDRWLERDRQLRLAELAELDVPPPEAETLPLQAGGEEPADAAA